MVEQARTAEVVLEQSGLECFALRVSRRRTSVYVSGKAGGETGAEDGPDSGREEDAAPGAADVKRGDDVCRDGEVSENNEEKLDGEMAEEVCWVVHMAVSGGRALLFRGGFATGRKERLHFLVLV